MLSKELLNQLQELSPVEKLRVVQLLVNELAVAEEERFSSGVEYPIYTPLGNEAAAQILLEELKAAEAADQG
jgi:hypothetical protein